MSSCEPWSLHELSRRRAIGLLAGAGAWFTLASCTSESESESDDGGSASSSVSTSTSEVPTATTVGPTTEVGDLAIRLWAEPTTAEIMAGISTDVYSFDAEVIDGDPSSIDPSDSYLGPTLHFRQGQRVRVVFENWLPDESIVHWHGLVVPQDQDGQPSDAVGPGETYDYDFVVTNEPGTYWYHPHPHGKTGEQVYRGLAGLIVVHGDEPDLPTGDNDIALVLQDRRLDAGGQLRYVNGMHDTMAGFVGDALITNGVADYSVDVRREPYRIRLLNGANSRTQFLRWSNDDPITAIATDGSLLPEPVTAPGLVITPAQRTDIWVDFSSLEPGTTIELNAADLFIENGAGGAPVLTGDVAATFHVIDSPAAPGSLPSSLGSEPDFGIADAVNASRPKQFTLSTRRMAHWINNLQWEGRSAVELETVAANSVEVWEFVNQSPMPHPMHLHGRSFRVTGRSWDDDGLAEAWQTIEAGVIDTGLRDTVLVWPGQRVQIVVPFAEHLGYFLYHCHILEHEDSGMMRNFRAI